MTPQHFFSAQRFEILQHDIKESDHDSFDNNSPDSSKDKEKTMPNRNTKAKALKTVNFGNPILKKYIWTYQFKDCQI